MSSHMDRPRRSCRIVPAVPRQFERKSTSDLDQIKPSRTATPDMQNEKGQAVISNTDNPALASGKQGNHDPPLSSDPVDQQRTPLSSRRCSDNAVAGKEPEPITSSDQLATEAREDVAANTVLEDFGCGSINTPVAVLTFGGNPTPPIDGPSPGLPWYPSPPFTSTNPLSHHPTPPSDMDPSPADHTQQSHVQPNATSSHPTENLESAEASSPSYPFYQGYMYQANSADQTVEHFDGHPDPLKRVNTGIAPIFYTYPSPELASSELHRQEILSRSSMSSGKLSKATLSQDQNTTPTGDADSAISASEVSKPHRIPEGADTADSQGEASRANFSSDGESASIARSFRTVTAYENRGWTLQDEPTNAGHFTHPLAEFILQQLNNPTYADCCVHVSYKDKQFPKEDLLFHSVLIAQSPKLASKLASCERKGDGMLHIDLETSSSFVTPSSLQHALSMLYGEPMDFPIVRHSAGSTFPSGEESKTLMASALAHAATGFLLDMQELKQQGMQVAASILGWDNVDLALSFVLDGYVDYSPDQKTISQLSTSSGHGTAHSPPAKDITDDSISTAYPHSDVVMAALCGPQGPQAGQLARTCLQFITWALSSGWKLDLTAAPMSRLDRLPLPIITRPPPSNSRFSHIQFGSLESVGPTHTDTRISAMLLSAPYVLLKDILRCTGQHVGAQKLADIVNEREQRRQQVLKNKNVLSSKRMECRDTWVPVGWNEVFDKTDIDGSIETKFTRKWTGFLTPVNV